MNWMKFDCTENDKIFYRNWLLINVLISIYKSKLYKHKHIIGIVFLLVFVSKKIKNYSFWNQKPKKQKQIFPFDVCKTRSYIYSIPDV